MCRNTSPSSLASTSNFLRFLGCKCRADKVSMMCTRAQNNQYCRESSWHQPKLTHTDYTGRQSNGNRMASTTQQSLRCIHRADTQCTTYMPRRNSRMRNCRSMSRSNPLHTCSFLPRLDCISRAHRPCMACRMHHNSQPHTGRSSHPPSQRRRCIHQLSRRCKYHGGTGRTLCSLVQSSRWRIDRSGCPWRLARRCSFRSAPLDKCQASTRCMACTLARSSLRHTGRSCFPSSRGRRYRARLEILQSRRTESWRQARDEFRTDRRYQQ